MNEPITSSLEAVQRLGTEAYASTALAADVGPTLRRVQRRRVARVTGVVAVTVVVVAAVVVGALEFGPRTVSPAGPSTTPTNPVPTVAGESVTVIVRPGDSGTVIAHALADAGVIASAQDFVDVAKDHPDEALRITPGYYQLTTGMTATEALNALRDDSTRVETKVTVPEGFTVDQILDRVVDHTGIARADLEAALADPASIGLPPEANGNAEGWLGPYTYVFTPDVTATEVLSAMVTTTTSDLEKLGVPRDQWLRVLTVASLVEREAKLDVDRPKIARVIQNRLDAGMALELDSTVRYAVGGESSVYTSSDDLTVDSPYNTYRYAGLPPGPIASPGEASINAALHPADGPWMFFVTVNLVTGETAYATTFPEHEKNVEKLRAWIMENQDS